MATNNNAHTLDSAGNTQVDFAWGNLPLQPNDVRTEGSAGNIGGSTGDYGWNATTKVLSDRLNFTGYPITLSGGIISQTVKVMHELAETGWGSYPAYVPAAGNFIVTAASGNGTTVTYTSQNSFVGGETVNITGLSNGAFNLSSATVATADATKFTVTNAAGNGVLITGQYGKVESTTALTGSDGSYITGVAYINVPSILGFTTALGVDALKDAGYAAGDITTATGAVNTATQPTRINVTATTAATVYVAGGTGTWAVGTKVTIASGTGIPAALVGTWTVTGGSGTTLVIAGSGWTVADTGSITPGTVLTGASGTVKAQSTAAGTGSVALGATITVTPWA